MSMGGGGLAVLSTSSSTKCSTITLVSTILSMHAQGTKAHVMHIPGSCPT